MSEKLAMVGERRFRLPFIDLIPFDEKQNAALGEAIREDGEIKVPVVCWKEKKTASEDTVVDGAHRIQWAAQHGVVKVPIRYQSFDSDEEAKAECQRINLERRHLTESQISDQRRQRIERVADLRRKGESLRAIADQEKISQAQIRRDLETASTAPGYGAVEPENGQIVGKDGKKRDAVAVVCKRCKRLGKPVPNCLQCERARTQVAKKRKKKSAPKDPHVDAFKNPVPDKRLAAWCDPWIQSAYDFLCVTSEKFRMERLPAGMQKREKFYPHFNVKDFTDGCGFVIQYLDNLIDHLKTNRPAGVCPSCSGVGCGDCRNAGLVPRERYAELKKTK